MSGRVCGADAPLITLSGNGHEGPQVPANLQGVVKAIRTLYDTCAAAVAAQPGKKREMEDNAKRLGNLFWKLNKNDVSQSVANSLIQLAAALNARDVAAATQIQVRTLGPARFPSCCLWSAGRRVTSGAGRSRCA